MPAGIRRTRPIDEFTVADFRAILELNVLSVFALCRAALRHLRQSRGSVRTRR